MKKGQNFNYKKLVDSLLSSLSERNGDVIIRRFGLGREKRETLESIGESYRITRERIRQIENAAMLQLRKPENLQLFEGVFAYIKNRIADHGYIVKEEALLNDLAERRDHPYLNLILTLGEPFNFFEQSEKYHPVWATDDKAASNAQTLVEAFIKYLNKSGKLITEKAALEFLRKETKALSLNLSNKALVSYLNISREIQKNSDGMIGLNHWIEIRPRGVRDKSYIVIKKTARPLHFTEVASLINEEDFSYLGPQRTAYSQTVHNELIKDERFVLIGRGLYALREWGYEPGVVKEIIARTLRQNKKPMTKQEILSWVLKQRQVKPNTVFLNLQANKDMFRKLEDGRFTLLS